MTSTTPLRAKDLECNFYRNIKLLEHTMKVFQRVTEARLRECVEKRLGTTAL